MARIFFVIVAFFAFVAFFSVVCSPVAYGDCHGFLRGDIDENQGSVPDEYDYYDLCDCVNYNTNCPTNNMDAADVDDDGDIDANDILYLYYYVWESGPEPPPPMLQALLDPTPDAINCACDVITISNSELENSLVSEGFSLTSNGQISQWPYPYPKNLIDTSPDKYIEVEVYSDTEKPDAMSNILEVGWTLESPIETTYGILEYYHNNNIPWTVYAKVIPEGGWTELGYPIHWYGLNDSESVTFYGDSLEAQLKIEIDMGNKYGYPGFEPEPSQCSKCGWNHWLSDPCSAESHYSFFEECLDWLFDLWNGGEAHSLEVEITAGDIIDNWPAGESTDDDTTIKILGVYVYGAQFDYENTGDELGEYAGAGAAYTLDSFQYTDPCKPEA